MDPALAPEISHPACSATSFRYDGDEVDPYAGELKQQLLEMILHAERRNPRGHQSEIGPSEMGDACDRRIAYRLAQTPEINTATDPWPAVVGTAIHAWLEGAAGIWNTTQESIYFTENEIKFDFGAVGHGDLFVNKCVIDWKSAGKDVMSNVRNHGPKPPHKVQVHLYGYGYKRMGYTVERVALAYVPRAGWIKDMYVWSEPYDESVALAAIQRTCGLAATALTLDVINYPHRWEQIPATPSDSCGVCPWFNPLRTAEDGASDLGCPGH